MDFLALFIRAAPITDPDFIDAQLPLGDLHRYLWLESEALFFQRNRLDDLAPESLVTSLHVAEVDVSKRVGEQSKNPVAYGMPEVKHAMRATGKKARTVDDVGSAFDQRLQQHNVLCRIVLEIGILNNDEVSGSFPNAAVQGRTFSHVLRLKQNSNLRTLRLQLRQDLA